MEYLLRILFKSLSKKKKKKNKKVSAINFYLNTSGKKNYFVQIAECIVLWRHWKVIPIQYIIYGLFLKKCNLSLSDMKQIIPSGIWSKELSANRRSYYAMTEDKALFSNLLSHYKLPQPELLCKFFKGIFFDQFNQMLIPNQVDSIIASKNYKKLFVKDNEGSGGYGISAFTRNTEGYYNGNHKLSSQFILDNYNDRSIIIQEGIVQDDKISEINPDCINSIRILTKYDKGNAVVIAACIRLGVKGSIVDNASSGGISVKVDVDTGRLGAYAKAFFDANDYLFHPDSGVVFDGRQIDKWEDVKSLAIKTAVTFHQLKYLGCDIAITRDGLMLIEVNSRPSLYLLQMTDQKLGERLFD